MRKVNLVLVALVAFAGVGTAGCGTMRRHGGASGGSGGMGARSAGGGTGGVGAGGDSADSGGAPGGADGLESGGSSGVGSPARAGASGSGASNAGMSNGGMAGGAGTAPGGAGATGNPERGPCRFTINEALSTAIPTVGIVDWSTEPSALSAARIEFTLNDAAADVLNRGSGGPISVEGTTHRALLLGLKPERTYTYRIVAQAGADECTSPERTLATGARPTGVRTVSRNPRDPSAQALGFIITVKKFTDNPDATTIVDADGDEVWWGPVPPAADRVQMNWAGTDLWALARNDGATGGSLIRISMDGTDVGSIIPSASTLHHDFTVLPGGTVAALSWAEGKVMMPLPGHAPSDIVEYPPDGTTRVVPLSDALGSAANETYQASSLSYVPSDDTYVVGDSDRNVLLKLDRNGRLLWELGSACVTSAPRCATADFERVAGGHHVTLDGHLLFRSESGASRDNVRVFDYVLTETSDALEAEPFWDYPETGTLNADFGDVQRLPNGNVLIDFAEGGEIREVAPDQHVVQILTAYKLGYVNFRETLYGPPTR